jgi:hypothetical protein
LKRRFVLGTGALALAAYAAGSWLSASLGVVSSTMLDGLSPPPPYRWVNPPPELARDNQEALRGRFPLALSKKGSSAGAFSTSDGQATLVVSEGSIAPSPGADALQVEIEPLDPADVGGRLPEGLEITGNVYRMSATYKPGGEEVKELTEGGDQRIILLYPAEAGEHRAHTLVASPDGDTWTKLTTQDSSGQQQAQGAITSLGYFAVAAPRAEKASSTQVVAIVALAVVLLVLAALVVIRNVRRGQGRSARAGRG